MILKTLLTTVLTLSSLMAITGEEIAQKVHDRDDGDNITSEMKMTLIDKNDKQRVRQLKVYTKDKGIDTQKLMFFMAPADVKNTGFLTYDYDDSSKDDDQWLYLPELQKVKRIASSDKSSSFMGSDFTYSDMTKRNVKDYTYKIMKESVVGGHKTWQILVTPKSEKTIDETGYTKSIIFVRQDNFVIVQALNYIKAGKKLKYMMLTGLEKIDGIWTTTKIQMVTKKGKKTLHKTILEFSSIKYNQDLKESFFVTRTIEKGL
ncbi:outer membrane lipoprotein-sorting protein [Candidatus Sulfurimonas marisnigri]|uniref:Outer membrane lipoprotein-sorting protein n=1 Tax=Candidatus Sulfurimonas marisnigri TaxID=2740405 RepID=A0A7S7LZ55_9BACT|nr:outer membrane lipoprotein-sorting protein [Candidatus Sulfurimonas marisnigri]QOY53553.1 outer membrane lipoprotein-sorting protein [Candidatus Sulfurimonas marisnigri]